MKLGIVGLPNVGKSTLFNAITGTGNAQAANYPFCTIEPNVGVVAVPDERLDKINEDLQLIQKKNGLTFGTDALLLAAFVGKLYRAVCAASLCFIKADNGVFIMLFNMT